MFQNIANDLRLYRRLVGMQLRAQTQYKFNLFVDIITFFLVTTMEFGAMLLYFGPFPTLLGWHVGEVALLYAVTSISFGQAELFGGGIDSFDTIIRLGEFDRVLLRPVGTLVQVCTNEFRLRRLGRITQGVLCSGIALLLLPTLHWTLLKFLALLLGILSGAIIFSAILLLGATLCFWTVETTELTNILTYGGHAMLCYPLTIYNAALQRFFVFVVPLAFGTYIPTCYILGRSLPFGLPAVFVFLAPLAALAFALLTAAVWQFGVHRYQSTGT